MISYNNDGHLWYSIWYHTLSLLCMPCNRPKSACWCKRRWSWRWPTNGFRIGALALLHERSSGWHWAAPAKHSRAAAGGGSRLPARTVKEAVDDLPPLDVDAANVFILSELILLDHIRTRCQLCWSERSDTKGSSPSRLQYGKVSGRAGWGRQRRGCVAARPLQRGCWRLLRSRRLNKLAYDIIHDISWSSCMISSFISCDIISIGPQHSHCGEAALKHWRHPLAACLGLMVVFHVYSQLELPITGAVVQW